MVGTVANGKLMNGVALLIVAKLEWEPGLQVFKFLRGVRHVVFMFNLIFF